MIGVLRAPTARRAEMKIEESILAVFDDSLNLYELFLIEGSLISEFSRCKDS